MTGPDCLVGRGRKQQRFVKIMNAKDKSKTGGEVSLHPRAMCNSDRCMPRRDRRQSLKKCDYGYFFPQVNAYISVLYNQLIAFPFFVYLCTAYCFIFV